MFLSEYEGARGRQYRRQGNCQADFYSRLAGYVGRVPRGGSVVPTGGVLNPGNDNNGDEDMEQPVRPRKRRRVSSNPHSKSIGLEMSTQLMNLG